MKLVMIYTCVGPKWLDDVNIPGVISPGEELVAHNGEDVEKNEQHNCDVDDRKDCFHDDAQQHAHCLPCSCQFEDTQQSQLFGDKTTLSYITLEIG
jgi:hypothetical protein